jgi:hypothetical protein
MRALTSYDIVPQVIKLISPLTYTSVTHTQYIYTVVNYYPIFIQIKLKFDWHSHISPLDYRAKNPFLVLLHWVMAYCILDGIYRSVIFPQNIFTFWVQNVFALNLCMNALTKLNFLLRCILNLELPILENGRLHRTLNH